LAGEAGVEPSDEGTDGPVESST
jgi:hypothetical protein